MRTGETMVDSDASRQVSVGSRCWRDAAGRRHLTAFVKAAFSLAPGLLALRPEPPPLDGGEDPVGDRVPLKAAADVIVLGPLAPGAGARQLLRLSVGRGTRLLLDKLLVAVGDTLVAVDGGVAALGPSLAPGSTSAAVASAASGEELTLDERLDAAVFQRAPADQRLPYLLGGEQLRLDNLVNDHPELHCRLPALHGWAALRAGGDSHPIALVADTLVVDLRRDIVTVTWRGFVRLDADGPEPRLEAGLVPVQALEEVRGEPPQWRKERARSDAARPFAAADLVNRTPLVATTVAWKRAATRWERALIVKGTFDIVPDARARIAPEQLPIEGDRLDPGGGLAYASDAAPFKPQADVLLRGKAYRRPEEAVALVTLELGPVLKSVVAMGDRKWTRGGEPGDPAPFDAMPLGYERSFGGPGHASNPVGTGLGESKLPNFELPDRLIRSAKDRPPPAGFGPLPLGWRKASAGIYDRAWLEGRWPGLPESFDPALFQAAPTDQRCAYLQGDESFVVHRVRPGGEALRGLLPGITPRAWARRRGATSLEAIALALDTAFIDAEAGKLLLLWRGSLGVADDEASDLAQLLVALGADLDEAMAWAMIASSRKPAAEPQAPPPRTVGELLAAGLPAPAVLTASPRLRELVLLPAVPAPPKRTEIQRWIGSPAGLSGRDLTGADLHGLDLRGKDLSRALLAHACLDGVTLDGAQLTEATLTSASAVGASFRDAILVGVDATGARLGAICLDGAELTRAILDRADLSAASLRRVRGAGASLRAARLDRACLDQADLSGADLSGAALEALSARRAVLDDARLYDCHGSGVCLDEASLRDGRLERASLPALAAGGLRARGSVWTDAQLEGARLLGSDLEEASFEGALLDGAIAGGASAPRARFVRASLVGASLLRADLMQATFEKADLRRADLRRANLYQAELWQARLEGARLEQAHLAGTKLKGR